MKPITRKEKAEIWSKVGMSKAGAELAAKAMEQWKPSVSLMVLSHPDDPTRYIIAPKVK